MRALLAIDGGLHSAEAVSLRQSLIESGLAVVMIGPERRELVDVGGLPESINSIGADSPNEIFIVNGSPLACVQVALGSGLVGEVDVVIAGLGSSGPFGESTRTFDSEVAAKEAALIGRPAMSVTFEDKSSNAIDWVGTVVADLAAWLLASPAPVRSVLKVTVPAVLGHRALKLVGSRADGRAHSGHICLEPVNLDDSSAFAGERLLDWAEETIAAINPRLGVSDGRCLAGCCG